MLPCSKSHPAIEDPLEVVNPFGLGDQILGGDLGPCNAFIDPGVILHMFGNPLGVLLFFIVDRFNIIPGQLAQSM